MESPTGTPVIPPWLMPYITAAASLVALGATALPANTLVQHACAAILPFLALIGMASPGLRQKPQG